MHPPRPPSIDQGITSFVWALVFALYVWAFMLGVGLPLATSVIFGALVGGIAFLLVRVYGVDVPRRPRRVGRRGA